MEAAITFGAGGAKRSVGPVWAEAAADRTSVEKVPANNCFIVLFVMFSAVDILQVFHVPIRH